ncbi:MAG: LamG domain-containing protein, partial [Methanobacteriota archaeon]
MLISADVGPVLANDDSEPFKNHRPLAIESLENPREALQVLNGELNSSVLKEKRAPIKTAFHSKEIFSSEQTFLRKIRDSGENLNEFRVENKETLRIETVTKTWLERPDGTNKEEVTETVDTFFVPGLLEHVVHTINSSGNGQVFLDSEAENYQINSKDVIKSLVKKDGREGVDSKHFELVVFVSDYKSRSIEKLRENKVWKQVYSDLLAWAEETSDYFVFLVNEFATPQNIMNLLAEAQENSKIDKIGFTFVGHGVNSIYGQGILTHRDDDPKKFGIMNGKVFENALKKTGTDRLTKLVHTNIHACFQIDAWEENGKNSVLGFFESQNPQQVLTGYRGLTYLNTRFVLALENLLSAGTYIFPRVERKTPVVITQNNGNATVPLGEALLREVKTIDISLLDEDLPAQYEENFDGDDTLFVHDINYSPAPEGERGSAVYSDTSVYETLGTTPPSYFPVEGAPYSFEGHRKGTWTTLTAVDDDERFYFARGGYDAFSDEFSALSSRWNAPNVATTNGYAIVQPGEYLRESTSFTTNRPLNSKATILFEIETISSSTSAVISLNGQANNGLVPSGFTTDRSFGIYITQGYAYAFARGQFFYPQAVNWVESRPYLLTIEFVGDVGIATLTTSEDNDFMISFEVGGFADMINPWLNVHSLQSSTIKVDFYEIAPSRSKSSLQGSFNLIYEDKSVSSIKISGAGGTADSNMEFVNGMRALVAGSTTNPDWLDSPTTIVDSTSRYLVFWAKIPSTTTQFRLGLKVLQGSTLATYYIEPKDMSSTVSLWDFVLKRDNQWHAYIVDLYETFGISYGSIEQFSVQRNTGTVYVDSIFLTRSIGEARDLISSSKRTSEELDTYLENTGEVGVPDAYLQFENNLADSGPNSFDGTFNSASSWIEDFNDNSISSVWTVQNHANMQFREQNQRMEGYQILGGSGNQLAYLTKSISGSQLIQAEIDASYYFPKIGRIYFAGLDSNGKRIWLLGNSDGWAYEGGSMVMSFYDANGNYMSSASFASGSNGLPAQGSLHMKMQYDPSTYTYTLSTTGSYTKTHSFSFATARETAQIQITFGRHATYYSTSSYWRMDNLVETYGASNPVYSSGKVGNGIHLDGNDEWVKIENPNLNPQEQVTMSAWVKLDTIGTYHPVIIQKGTLNSWGRGISITPDGKPYVFSRDASGTWKSVVSTTSMSTGLWTHLAFVQNGQYIYGYMNGILFASLDMGSHSTMQSFFSLGAFPLDNNYRLDGVIDEVFIFSSALSTEQINNLASGVTLNAKYYLGSGEDSSGWDITLNEINSPTYGSSGLVGSYLEHKSTGQRLSGNPNGKLNNVKTFTASIWMQYLATPANWHDIFYLQGSGQRTFDIFIGSSVLGTNFIDANTGSYRTTSVSLANVPVETDRAWHMYTSVWDGTYLRLYVDGVQVASANFAGSMPGQTPTVLAIGDGQFNANLADARIYRGAMSTAQIQALYRQTKPVQSYSMEPLTTDDNPLYTFSTTIEKGDISGSKVAEFKVQVGSSYYGLKLENNVWKYLGGSSIAQLSGFAEGSYTIQFDIYKTKDSYGVTATNLAVSVTPDGANTTEVIKTTIPTGVVIPHVNVLPGYITTTTISSSAQLGSSLYTVANGLLTEGAFAIKFEQETYVETATVTAIVNTYGNNLLGLAEDYLVFLQCGTVDVNPNTCPDPEFIPGSPYDSNFINTIQNVRGLNLNAAGIKWQDRWFNTVLKDYGNNVISRLEAKQIGTDYYFYYNKPRTSLTVELTVEGINGHDFKLTKVSSSGSILATYSGTTYPYTTTLTVDPTQMHFFYLQIAHDADISNIGINFKPLAPNTYAHYEGLNPNGISTEVRSTYSLLTDPVSYVKYRWDENGNPVEPVFEALPEINGRYWLHKMVTMGGLPQQGNTPIGTHITADTYASSANPIGEKLVAGTKYWNTQNGAEEFYTKVLSSDGTFQLTHNVAYMTSFAIQSRSKMTVQLDIIVTETSEIDLYLDGTDPLPRPIPVQTGPGSSLRKYSYYVDIGTSLSSFLIKIVARETSYTTQRIIGSSILTYS